MNGLPERPLRIILADDHPIFRLGLRAVLEHDPALSVVAEADGPASLLAALGNIPCDVLITDFMMPGMNGLELAQKIRSHATLKAVPILLMSGAQGNVGRATPELFDAVYDKPFDINEVVARIRELVPLDSL